MSSTISLDATPAAEMNQREREGGVLGVLVVLVEWLAGAVLAADVLIVFVSVIWRYFLDSPINWTEEIASALMVALTFLGAATVLARSRHSSLEIVRSLFPAALRPVLHAVCLWLIVTVAGALMWSSSNYMLETLDQTTPLGLPQWIFSAPTIFGSLLMLVVALAKALKGPTSATLLGAVIGVLLPLGLWYVAHTYPDYALPPAALVLIGFALTIVIGLPIAFALAFATLLYFLNDPSLPMSIYSQQIIAGASHFVLLAIPFFVLAGLTMEANGMSIRLIELLLRMIGRVRGGLNIVTILATAFFSGVSGSKLADIAAVGSVMMPAVRRTKQDPNDAAGLLAATAVMSETIPPCVNMIILGFVANISIGGLFAAGLVPAVVLTVALLAVVFYFGKKVDTAAAFPQRRSMPALIGGAMVGLLMIIMIGRGVMLGVATSTEISAFAVVYAFVVGGLAFRELTWRSVVNLFVQSASTTGAILFIVAAASGLAFSLSIEQIPQHFSAFLIDFGTHYGPLAFMLAASVMMIIFGSVLEGAPALIIFGPLLMPVAIKLGISPYHFGIVTVVAMGIGLCAPPLGIGVYTACAVTETKIEDVSWPLMKYLAVFIIMLVLLIFVPSLSTWLPQHWGL